MRHKYDHVTLDLFSDAETVPQPPSTGRLKKIDALSEAERAKRYRARKKARLTELRDKTVPVSSTLIDLSALPAWKRK